MIDSIRNVMELGNNLRSIRKSVKKLEGNGGIKGLVTTQPIDELEDIDQEIPVDDSEEEAENETRRPE